MGIPVEYHKNICLVVDDESSMRRTISNMLTRMGFSNILNADNGASALTFVQNTRVDLIICDINMPEMSGLEFYRVLLGDKRHSDIAIVFVTAEVRRNIVARTAEEGGAAYVIKPFVMATLEDKIEQVLKHKYKPAPFEVHMKNFHNYMDSQNLGAAEAELNKALAESPDSPTVIYYLGQLALRKGMTDVALERFEDAIKKKPMFVKAYDAMAKIYEDDGDIDKAIKYYESANKISASNSDRLVVLSRLYVKRGENARATDLLKGAAASMTTDRSSANRILGELYMATNDNTKALDLLVSSYKKNPSDTAIMQSLAEAYRKNAKPEEAVKMYQSILDLAPNNADIYHAIGKTHLETGDKEAAIMAITKAWELNPSSKEITRDLRGLAEKQKLNL